MTLEEVLKKRAAVLSLYCCQLTWEHGEWRVYERTDRIHCRYQGDSLEDALKVLVGK